MYVTEILLTGAVAHSRERARDEKRTERQRTGFSASHVILDLSLEAMKRIGYEALSLARPPQPLLFVYNGAGAFAYDGAARRSEEAQQHALARIEKETLQREMELLEIEREMELLEIEPGIGAAHRPMPSFVAFDGMLGSF